MGRAYRQWAGAGAQIRKDEKSAFVVFYKELEIAAETGEGETENDLSNTRIVLSKNDHKFRFIIKTKSFLVIRARLPPEAIYNRSKL